MRWITIFTDKMIMIVYPRVRREQFLANVTTRRTTVRLPLFFRQRFYRHISEYNIFHAMRQVSSWNSSSDVNINSMTRRSYHSRKEVHLNVLSVYTINVTFVVRRKLAVERGVHFHTIVSFYSDSYTLKHYQLLLIILSVSSAAARCNPR